jgi:glycosyltransferase involved in cell wall biosynthesis
MDHMNKLKSILTIGAIIACILPSMAQQKRISPHETVSKVIDGNRVMIVYGRPYTKDPTTGQITGLLRPFGGTEKMARAVENLIQDAPLRTKIGDAAKSRAHDVFSARVIVPRYESLYRRVCEIHLAEG